MKFVRFFSILTVAVVSWFFASCPAGLDPKAWHMLIIFVSSMIGIMLEVAGSCAVLFIGLLIASLSETIDLKTQGFTGFTNPVPWLLFFVLSLAKSITKSTIGLRIAYMFMKWFGKGIVGLSYSITLTELLVAPILPSNTARAASVGFPLVSSLSKHISSNVKGVTEKTIGAYLSLLYAYSNAICSSMFLTAMISNALIMDATEKIGVKLTWIFWAQYTIMPCIAMLLILPFVLKILCNPKVRDLGNTREVAVKNYKELGPLTGQEKVVICVFLGMLLMWIFSDTIGVSITTTTLLGVCIFIMLGILDIREMLSCSNTFNSVIMLGILISFVNVLLDFGAIDWFNKIVSSSITVENPKIALCILSATYFFTHYFFSGEASRIIALYAPFLATGLALGIDKIQLIMTLAVFSSFSDVLSHYTCPAAITMFSAGYVSVKKWVSVGIVMACIVMSIWFLYICAF